MSLSGGVFLVFFAFIAVMPGWTTTTASPTTTTTAATTASPHKILDVIDSNVTLPSTMAWLSTPYDGSDSIYIFGSRRREILKFSVSTNTVQEVGQMSGGRWGNGVWAGDGNFYYIGGLNSSAIWKFTSNNPNNWTTMNHLPTDRRWATAVRDGGSDVYVIGGSRYGNDLASILRYSTETNEVEAMPDLPSARYGVSAARDGSTGNIFIFGGWGTSGNLDEIVKFNPKSRTTTRLKSRLPAKIGDPCAVSTGRFIYVFGGCWWGSGPCPPIVRFDPVTEDVTPIPVNNFPDSLYGAGCAFVETLNRIYLFGGFTHDGDGRAQIMHINL